MTRILAIGISLTLVMAAMAADTIMLKDGRVITGTYLGGSPREVKLNAGDQIQTLDVADIVLSSSGQHRNGTKEGLQRTRVAQSSFRPVRTWSFG